MICIVDYNTCNVGSLLNMIKKIGFKSTVVKSGEELLNAEPKKIIIPGVGAFGKGMSNLYDLGFIDVLNKKVIDEKIDCLGICLGMQLMTQGSEESPEAEGLCWFNGTTKKFVFAENEHRVPHMGWNNININSNCSLFRDLPDSNRFYFVHSYYVALINESEVASNTNYGIKFNSSIQRNNIFGVQFHPEKSSKYGQKLLENYINN